jgi:transposase
MQKEELKKDLEVFYQLMKQLVSYDLLIVEAINAFHKKTENKYYNAYEEYSDVYPRLLRLIDVLANDLGEIVAQDHFESSDL